MRISDCSSDVCSSDLIVAQGALRVAQCGQDGLFIAQRGLPLNGLPRAYLRAHAAAVEQAPGNERQDGVAGAGGVEPVARAKRLKSAARCYRELGKERTSVVEGQSVSVLLDLGGRRYMKKKKKKKK